MILKVVVSKNPLFLSHTAVSDFETKSEIVTFTEDGNMTIPIPIVVDSEAEEPEVFTVGVSLVSVSEGLVLGQMPDNQPVIILDADGKNYKKYISRRLCQLSASFTTCMPPSIVSGMTYK